MEDVGNKMIYRDGFLIIIIDQHVVDADRLKWHEGDEGIEMLTLNEISDQINTEGVIYVWTELGLSGKIYQYGNYEEIGWCVHGKTKGYS
ncbi:hypothetical protein [Sporosarcina sp. FSL K6-1508]|uniref:hypothetical protein n=1 Tax=Sporosarcina sp. FSL K6-1508 TaxID=2921553 RepID=UPI0030F8F70D